LDQNYITYLSITYISCLKIILYILYFVFVQVVNLAVALPVIAPGVASPVPMK
jgi:hypothetical protein